MDQFRLLNTVLERIPQLLIDATKIGDRVRTLELYNEILQHDANTTN